MVAVLIGVSQYEQWDEQWVDRESADPLEPSKVPARSSQVVSRHVKAIAQVLQQSGIGQVCQSQVTELIDPTPEKMRHSIEQLFCQTNGDDLRLLYFCGSAVIGTTGKLYLSVGTSESNPQPVQTPVWTRSPMMISLDWVLEVMEQSPSEKVVVILDCLDVINERKQVSEKISCRSFNHGGVLSHITLEPKKINPLNSFSPKALLDQLAELTRQGDFPTYTDYLVAGIVTGEADLDGDGIISLGEWHEYAQRQMTLFAPGRLPRMYAPGNEAEMAIAKTPRLNSYPEYRQTVAEFAKRHHGTLPLIAQRSLDVRRDSRQLTPEITTSIQKTVLAPYQHHQIKLKLYRQVRQSLMPQQDAMSPETLNRLKYLQQMVLELTDEDIAAIEQPRQTSSSSADRFQFPWLILTGLLIALLSGGGMYALVSNYLQTRSLDESSETAKIPESTTNQPNSKPKSSVSLPSPPTDLVTPQANANRATHQLSDRFRIPTKEPITLKDHTGSVQAVAIAPDRQILVTGSADRTIKLWNLAHIWETDLETDPLHAIDQRQFLIGTLRGHTGSVRTLAISANGQTLASGSNDNTIKLWNLAPNVEPRGSGRNDELAYLQATLSDHVGAVYALAFLPNQNILISGSGDWTIKIWDLTTNQVIKTLRGHQGSVRALAVSADGHTLVSGSSDGTVKVWDLRTRELKQTLRGHTDLVRAVAISPDGHMIASGSWDRTIKLWPVESEIKPSEDNQEDDRPAPFLRDTLTGHTNHVNSLVFTADGQTLISGSDDNTIKVWQLDLEPKELDRNNTHQLASLKATLNNHSSEILSLAISGYDWQYPQSYPLLVSGNWDETVKIWW